MRARGLKRESSAQPVRLPTSRPMRARGLKHWCPIIQGVEGKSRPMRARGLKPAMLGQILILSRRAPCGRVD